MTQAAKLLNVGEASVERARSGVMARPSWSAPWSRGAHPTTTEPRSQPDPDPTRKVRLVPAELREIRNTLMARGGSDKRATRPPARRTAQTELQSTLALARVCNAPALPLESFRPRTVHPRRDGADR
jgi:hypothetical protein